MVGGSDVVDVAQGNDLRRRAGGDGLGVEPGALQTRERRLSEESGKRGKVEEKMFFFASPFFGPALAPSDPPPFLPLSLSLSLPPLPASLSALAPARQHCKKRHTHMAAPDDCNAPSDGGGGRLMG